jgi:hypothetical protein
VATDGRHRARFAGYVWYFRYSFEDLFRKPWGSNSWYSKGRRKQKELSSRRKPELTGGKVDNRTRLEKEICPDYPLDVESVIHGPHFDRKIGNGGVTKLDAFQSTPEHGFRATNTTYLMYRIVGFWSDTDP